MSPLLSRLPQLSSAEDFFRLFDLPYNEAVLNVSRLHILKRFQQYLAREPLDALDDDAQFARCRALLARAHEDFTRTKPIDERLFKVFRDADGHHEIGLNTLRSTLPSRRATA